MALCHRGRGVPPAASTGVTGGGGGSDRCQWIGEALCLRDSPRATGGLGGGTEGLCAGPAGCLQASTGGDLRRFASYHSSWQSGSGEAQDRVVRAAVMASGTSRLGVKSWL